MIFLWPCTPSVFSPLLCCITSVVLLPPFSSIPLVYHAIVAVVRDGGAYSGCGNSHRSACLQSTPKPADSQQKIKGDKKKVIPQLFSFLPNPLLSQPSKYRSLLHSLVPSSFSAIIPAIFHLTLFSPGNISLTV